MALSDGRKAIRHIRCFQHPRRVLTSDSFTVCFFSKFVSRANNSNKHRPSEFSRRDKILSSKFIPKCAGPFMYVNLGNFFSAEIRKMTFVIFETNVSSRKPCVWASKASFAQKLQEFCRQNFISSRELRTGKIAVLPGFCGIEHGSSSMPVV